MNANYIQMTTCAACIALAFGLSGCADETIEQGHGTGNAEQTQGLTFVAEMPTIPTVPTTPAKPTRLGAEEKDDRISFRWTSGDYAYLYCDVTPLEANATWKKPQQQYGIAVDPDRPNMYRSTAFVFPDLKPLYTDSREDGWGNPFNPTTSSDGKSSYTYITQAMDPEIYAWNSSSVMHDGGFYTYYSYQRAGLPNSSYQASYYPILFTNFNGGNRVVVRNSQRQGASGYPDSLAWNGACFVGVAFANSRSVMYNQPGFNEEYKNDGGGHWEYTWTRYTLYTGNANNTSDIWRTGLPSVVNPNGSFSIAYNRYNNYPVWPMSHGTLMKLGHKTSYISIMPYNPKGAMPNVSLVTATIEVGNQAINGTHNFSVKGIDLSNRSAHNTSQYKRITLAIDPKGVPIASTRENARKHPAMITALPGVYTGAKVVLTFKDNGTGVTLNHIQNYGMAKMNLLEGRNLPLYYKLSIPSYGQMSNSYHMWGSNDTYWLTGTEPTKWKFNGTTGSIDTTPGYATGNGDSRWYNDYDMVADPASQTGNAPQSNDVSYALDKCYWDDQTTYIFEGHLFRGLVWIPIITKGHSTASDGSDWTAAAPTTSSFSYLGNAVHNVAGYFPLPALGYWENGALKGVGEKGCFWLADGDPAGDMSKAYTVQFDKNGIKIVSETPKNRGCMAMPINNILGDW